VTDIQKYIQKIVVLLFMGAWVLQSFAPLLQYVSQHPAEMAVCNMKHEDGASCSSEGNGSMVCNCNHTASGNDGVNNLTLCGCEHQSSDMLSVTSPFQIKAPLPGSFSYLRFSSSILAAMPFVIHENSSPDDIFRPPRQSA